MLYNIKKLYLNSLIKFNKNQKKRIKHKEKLIQLNLDYDKITENKYKQKMLDLNLECNKITEFEYKKEIANLNKEPYIQVIKINLDPEHPNVGNFELDWNKFFIDELVGAGYTGINDEAIIDSWFNSVCRNILLEEFNEKNFVQETPIVQSNRKKITKNLVEKY